MKFSQTIHQGMGRIQFFFYYFFFQAVCFQKKVSVLFLKQRRKFTPGLIMIRVRTSMQLLKIKTT